MPVIPLKSQVIVSCALFEMYYHHMSHKLRTLDACFSNSGIIGRIWCGIIINIHADTALPVLLNRFQSQGLLSVAKIPQGWELHRAPWTINYSFILHKETIIFSLSLIQCLKLVSWESLLFCWKRIAYEKLPGRLHILSTCSEQRGLKGFVPATGDSHHSRIINPLLPTVVIQMWPQ